MATKFAICFVELCPYFIYFFLNKAACLLRAWCSCGTLSLGPLIAKIPSCQSFLDMDWCFSPVLVCHFSVGCCLYWRCYTMGHQHRIILCIGTCHVTWYVESHGLAFKADQRTKAEPVFVCGNSWNQCSIWIDTDGCLFVLASNSDCLAQSIKKVINFQCKVLNMAE